MSMAWCMVKECLGPRTKLTSLAPSMDAAEKTQTVPKLKIHATIES